MPRRVILVLGMHRSGTSALTTALGHLGAVLPRDPMPASADNPGGYQESRAIARFHNRLLESAGTRWNDDAPIPAAWFADPARDADEAEATALLASEFGAGEIVALKDPRLCRLLPLWKRVLSRTGAGAYAILALRDPWEVARSLRARLDDAAFRPSGIAAGERALLLWLRHLLDAERASRDLPRVAVAYPALLADWRAALEPVFAAGALPRPTFAGATAIDHLLSADLRRQHAAEAGAFPAPVADDVARACGPDGAGARGELDAIATAFDRLRTAAAPWRGGDAAAPADPWGASILGALEGLRRAGRTAAPTRSPAPRILFLSAAPASAGHVYRVDHAMAALGARGWRTTGLALGDPRSLAAVGDADVVVLFRARWGEAVEAVRAAAAARGIPLVYDIDDLLFDAGVMAAGHVALLDTLPEDRRRAWLDDADLHRRALAACDACVTTTGALADAAATVVPRVHVVPNGVDARMVVAADAARAVPRPSALDGLPRVGFAAGTPTHHRDFATIVPVVVRLLARRSDVRLVVVGHLDVAAIPDLAPHAGRIEIRPAVPLAALHGELARFDVNLAPLEAGNPFCEAKSAIRCTAAALVGCPSVVAATAALADAVVEGETGYVARDGEAWMAAVENLLDDAGRRAAMGEAARSDVLARYGPALQEERFERAYGTILAARPRGGVAG